jgi:hypothetical protein
VTFRNQSGSDCSANKAVGASEEDTHRHTLSSFLEVKPRCIAARPKVATTPPEYH